MKKNVRKGFTLIELIIVMALFGIILALVMSFIQPASKLMKSTAMKEKTAAYVDNVGDYVRSSLHYAKYIYVFDGAFLDTKDQNTTVSEYDAVLDFVDNSFNGAYVNSTDRLKGKVRVLKLINDAAKSDDPTAYEDGRIYETIYDFTAGEKVTMGDASAPVSKTFADPSVTITSQVNKEVVNPEHFKDYNYFYKLGFYDLSNKVTVPSDPKFETKTTEYFSGLVPMTYTDSSGMEKEMSMDNTAYNFSMSIVAYQHGNMVEDSGNVFFKSPARISNVSMSFINAINASTTGTFAFYKRDYTLNSTTNEIEPTVKGSYVYNQSKAGSPYLLYPGLSSVPRKSSNIYIIYVLSSETNEISMSY